MASQGALEYPGRRSSHAVGWMDMEPGSVEAAEQVETRERRKENTRLLDSRLCNPSRKLTATVSSSVEGASPKVLPPPTLGSRKKIRRVEWRVGKAGLLLSIARVKGTTQVKWL